MEDRNRKVEIRSLNKNKFGGLGLYPNSSGVVLVPQLTKGGFKTGLTKEEEKHFEETLNLKPGELSKKSEFWSTIELRIKNKVILDLNEDWDYLKFKFANVHTRICPSPAQISNYSGAEFMIIDEEAQAKVDAIDINYEIKAFESFVKLTEEDKKGLLTLYGVKTSNTSLDMINSKLMKFLKADPKKFVEVVTDVNRQTKIFIEELLEHRIIRKEKSFYKNGDEIIASSIDEIIEYLKSPKNSAILSNFKQRLSKFKD